MIVFSNTTPFIALASIDRLNLLPEIFGTVHVASAVIEECAQGGRIMVPSLLGLGWVNLVRDVWLDLLSSPSPDKAGRLHLNVILQ